RLLQRRDRVAELADRGERGQRLAGRYHVVALGYRQRDGQVRVVHPELLRHVVERGRAELHADLAEGGVAGLGERRDQRRLAAPVPARLALVVVQHVLGLRQGERGRRVHVRVDRGVGALRQQGGTRHDLERRAGRVGPLQGPVEQRLPLVREQVLVHL